MNKDVKRLWVDRLRNPGKVRQGHHYLTYRDQDGNVSQCCLGVLTQLAVEHGVGLEVEIQDRQIDYVSVRPVELIAYSGELFTLPDKVKAWAGLSMTDPWLVVPDLELSTRSDLDGVHSLGITASGANDHLRLTFHEIADLIEWGL